MEQTALTPDGCGFVCYHEIAERFGEVFAKQLAADHHADPKPLIAELFRKADPVFTEPDPESGYDLPAIRASIREHVVDHLTGRPEAAAELIDHGFAGLSRRTDDELVAMYEHVFGKPAPKIDLTFDMDDQRLAA